jgi:hypothetical protein
VDSNWRQILSWAEPVDLESGVWGTTNEEKDYTQDEDYLDGVQWYSANYSESVWGTVSTKAHCIREARDRLDNGEYDTEVDGGDNFEIDMSTLEAG